MADTNQSDLDFEKFLLAEYLKHGSIDKVFKLHHFDLPISFASYHRLLKEFGIIKSAGPNSKLSESLYLLSLLANYKGSLEKIYRLAPKKLQISLNTLHRILHYTRLGLTRRQGTALIITQQNNPDQILVGNDLSLSNSNLGQKGDYSLPMGHSKTGEDPKDSITRVLQQEVFTDLVINHDFPQTIVPEHPKPIMYINIADIRVAVYHLELSKTPNFSSFKLTNMKLRNIAELLTEQLRPGVGDILQKYLDLQKNQNQSRVLEFASSLNSQIYALAKLPSK